MDTDYVKCAVCGTLFKQITLAHLRQHNLTMQKYRQLYPHAPLISMEVRKKLSSRVFHRKCRNCGRPFTTGNTRAYYCQRCSLERKLERQRRYARQYKIQRRNTLGVRGKSEIGTFGERYLEVLPNGRVRGMTLLEIGLSINRSSVHNGFEKRVLIKELGFDYVIFDGRLFCGECGSKIIVARENKHYTIPAELCCKSCGTVIQLT